MKKTCLLLLIPALLTGCLGTTTRPSAFYVLDPYPGTPVQSGSATLPLSIGLGPLSLPEIYDRPQIVTRNEANRISLAEFDRWGGDLQKDLSRVLAHNLMTRLGTDSIVPWPWPSRYEPELQVTVRFFRFDGVLDHSADLEGIWRILDAGKGCELYASRFSITEPAEAAGYPALVSAMSRALAGLSQIIAEQVAATRPGCPKDA